MGSGRARQIKAFKTQQQMMEMQKQVQQMQEDFRKMATDPESAVGKLIVPVMAQLNESRQNEQKLCALAAALIQVAGSSVTMPRSLIEQFKGMRIKIEQASPVDDDGVNPETPITFTAIATPVETAPVPTVERNGIVEPVIPHTVDPVIPPDLTEEVPQQTESVQ